MFFSHAHLAANFKRSKRISRASSEIRRTWLVGCDERQKMLAHFPIILRARSPARAFARWFRIRIGVRNSAVPNAG